MPLELYFSLKCPCERSTVALSHSHSGYRINIVHNHTNSLNAYRAALPSRPNERRQAQQALCSEEERQRYELSGSIFAIATLTYVWWLIRKLWCSPILCLIIMTCDRCESYGVAYLMSEYNDLPRNRYTNADPALRADLSSNLERTVF